MNDDSIEKLLRELPRPEMPATWRAEILREARRAVEPLRREWPPLMLATWNLFARNPMTASALTLMWIMIFAFLVTTPVDPDEARMIVTTDFKKPVRFVSLEEQIRLEMLAEQEGESQPTRMP